jgi:hypothetical protein
MKDHRTIKKLRSFSDALPHEWEAQMVIEVRGIAVSPTAERALQLQHGLGHSPEGPMIEVGHVTLQGVMRI